MKKNAIKIKGNGFRGLDHSWWEYYSNRGLRCGSDFDFRWVNIVSIRLSDVRLGLRGRIIGDE